MTRYLLYARKSTESEDRQVLSIDSQIKELTDLARSRGITDAELDVLPESKSAKAPGRPMFGQLVQRVTKGGVDGIFCWKLDRLARNPVDGAALIWAMDQGSLKQIVTPYNRYTNTGNDKFLMQLEFGMAKKYVDDLSDNVKRGIRAKLEQGWAPGVPPLGYLNDVATRTIVADPNRFPLLRKMWDLILAGMPPSRVLSLANEDWGLRTRKQKHYGGGPLKPNVFYRMLANPYYCGLIVMGGNTYVGAHPPLITKDEFDTVHRMIFRPNRMMTKRHLFTYAGLMRCGGCGAAVTAEEKTNRFGSEYVYYHCTKRKAGVTCRQRFIQLRDLEAEIMSALGEIELSESYRTWALEQLTAVRTDDKSTRGRIVKSLTEAQEVGRRKMNALMEMRLSEQITAQEFLVKRQELVESEHRLREQLNSAKAQVDWIHEVEKTLSFGAMAKERFTRATPEEKREIVLAVGSHLELKDKKLNISWHKPFQIARKLQEAVQSRMTPFTPTENGLDSGESGRFEEEFSTPRGEWNLFRTFFYEHPTLIRWPKWCESSTTADSTLSSARKVGKG